MRPQNEAELAEAIAGATGPLAIQGGGTRPIGVPVDGALLETGGLSGITLYEPGALTLVVRAGTPMAEITAALDAESQRLAFEPMDHRSLLGTEGAPSIGGVVAGNVSGPRRLQTGACRDHLLGVRFVDGRGTVVKNGGRVMKNVTGLDLVKLLAGSWGTLGVLSEVSLKVLPKPESVAVLTLPNLRGPAALDAVTRAITSPFDVTGAADVPGTGVHIRIEGFAGSVGYRVDELSKLLKPLGEIVVTRDAATAAAIWGGVRDVEALKAHAYVWRVSMTPAAVYSGLLAGIAQRFETDVMTDWAGGLCWIGMTSEQAAEAAHALGTSGAEEGALGFHRALQEMVSDPAVTGGNGGHATLVKAPEAMRRRVPVFQPQPAAVKALSEGIKQRFDPKNFLNPGRMG